MKTILIFLIFFISQVFSQNNADSIKFSQRIPYDMKINVTVKESIPIGYAYCFSGKVIEVLKGNLKDEEITITVLANKDGYYDLFSKAGEDDIFELRLVFNKSDEPYSRAFVTGFVDSDRNSWRIVSVHKK